MTFQVCKTSRMREYKIVVLNSGGVGRSAINSFKDYVWKNIRDVTIPIPYWYCYIPGKIRSNGL
jgi:hypothetical protein